MLDIYSSEGHEQRLNAISLLLSNDPKLLDFLFDGSRRRLAASPRSLKRSAKAFSNGQRVLIAMALDIWDECGGARLSDVIYGLDTLRLSTAMLAIEALRFSSRPAESMIYPPELF